MGRHESRNYVLQTSAEYQVLYTDYAGPQIETSSELNKLFDAIRDSALPKLKSKLLSESAISLDGHPGRMMKAIDPHGTVTRVRLYAVGHRLYLLSVTTPKEGQSPDESRLNESRAAKFFDSFKVTKPESKESPGSISSGVRPSPVVGANPNVWKEYSSPQGGFTVLLPGTPTEEDKSFDTPDGRMEGREYVLKTSATYSVSYTVFLFDVEQKPDALNWIVNFTRDHIVEMTKGKVLVETEVSLDRHLGRVVGVSAPDGTTIRFAIIMVGNRTYQVMVITPQELSSRDGGQFDQWKAAKFLRSFKLAKRANGGLFK
jgi:hypothetical protein